MIKVNRKSASDDIVTLYQFARAPTIPNISGFCLKLETYLRMANIEYKNELGNKVSKKGKSPWIEHRGAAIADSQFCIDYLTEKLDKDLQVSLTDDQKGVARGLLQMTEHSLYWTYLHWRWIQEPDMATFQSVFNVPWIGRKYLQCKIKKSLAAQGFLAHTDKEVNGIAERDLKAISRVLGDNKYLFGDTAHEIDASVFGHVAQFRWAMPNSPGESYMRRECPNLWTYCQTMRDQYWPDWNSECSVSKSGKM